MFASLCVLIWKSSGIITNYSLYVSRQQNMNNVGKPELQTHSLSANEPTTVPKTMDEPNPTTKSWLICLDVIP